MKKKLLLVYVFVAFVLLCTNVYAVLTMDVNLVADKTSVKPGEEVLVTVNLKNISKPISSIEGYINIDETVFKESIQDALVTKDNKIEVTSENTASNKLSYVFDPNAMSADYDVIFNTKKANIENNDCLFITNFSGIYRKYFSTDDDFSNWPIYLCNLNSFIIKISSVNNIRIRIKFASEITLFLKSFLIFCRNTFITWYFCNI